MKILFLQTNRLWLKQFAATMLAIWLSGASCLLCCGPMENSAGKAEDCTAKVSLNESAEKLHNDDDCCAENSGSDHSSQNEPCQDECCILDVPASELPAGSKLNQSLAMAPPVALSLAFSEPVRTAKLPFSQQRPPEGQKIHLRCCVFLI